MLENKFEKSVQQEMQGFKLKPSQEVWPKVEERIREKKNRRIFFILFFLVGFALLGYWQRDYFFGGSKKGVATVDKNLKRNFDTVNSIKENVTTRNESQEKPEKSIEIKEKPAKEIPNKPKQEKNILPVSIDKQQSQTNKKDRLSVKHEEDEKPRQIISTTSQEKIESKENNVINSEILIKKDTVSQKEIAVVNETTKHNDTAIAIQNSISNTEIKKDTAFLEIKSDRSQSEADSNLVAIQKQASSKKWKWGFLFTPGISSFDDGILSLNTNKSADLLFANPNTSSGGITNYPAPPSANNAGFAFQTGAFIKNQYATRNSFSIGLQYAYYSEHISVGARKDTVLRYASQVPAIADANYAYSAGGSKENFTNSYHFIEIPAIFQFQLNKKKSSPFNWNVGISIGQLISAKSLAYDTAFGGIYYDNRKNLNKTQFSLTTGFNWGLFNDKKIKASLGPVMDLHFNSLMNNELDKNKHLFFAGLRSTINF